MNRLQYFWLGVLSSIMLCISTLLIGVGRMVYGSDAILIAVTGWMFYISVTGVILSIKELFAPVEEAE